MEHHNAVAPAQPPVRSAPRSRTGATPHRVLQAASTLHIGGAERVIASLAGGMSRERFEVTVSFLKENGMIGDEIRRAGIELVPLPGRHYGRPDRLTFLKLRRLIRQRGIELIHTHDVHGLMDAAMCRLLMPGLRHVHTFHFGNYPHREGRYRMIEQLLWRVPDRLVAVGHVQAATIRELYSIPAERLSVVWNGTDAPVARPAPEVLAAVAGCTDPIVASISTFIPQKGLLHLVEAAELLKNRGTRFRLLIVGDGPLREELQRQILARGLGEHVRLPGWIQEASAAALPSCDIFVQSSLWEAMSVVVLEAMANGKPCVVTSVGENPHIIQDGKTGLLARPGDAASLADALDRLLRDSDLRQRLGKAAQARHTQEFVLARMVDTYEDLYTRVLENRKAEAA